MMILPYRDAVQRWAARKPALTSEEFEALRIPVGHTLIVDDDEDEVATLRLARSRIKAAKEGRENG